MAAFDEGLLQPFLQVALGLGVLGGGLVGKGQGAGAGLHLFLGPVGVLGQQQRLALQETLLDRALAVGHLRQAQLLGLALGQIGAVGGRAGGEEGVGLGPNGGDLVVGQGLAGPLDLLAFELLALVGDQAFRPAGDGLGVLDLGPGALLQVADLGGDAFGLRRGDRFLLLGLGGRDGGLGVLQGRAGQLVERVDAQLLQRRDTGFLDLKGFERGFALDGGGRPQLQGLCVRLGRLLQADRLLDPLVRDLQALGLFGPAADLVDQRLLGVGQLGPIGQGQALDGLATSFLDLPVVQGDAARDERAGVGLLGETRCLQVAGLLLGLQLGLVGLAGGGRRRRKLDLLRLVGRRVHHQPVLGG